MKTDLLLEAAKQLLDSNIELPSELKQKFIDAIEQAEQDLVKHVTSDKTLRRFRIVMESRKRYKTILLSKQRFDELKNNTLEDWRIFLRDCKDECLDYRGRKIN